jgi:hypothetical protein
MINLIVLHLFQLSSSIFKLFDILSICKSILVQIANDEDEYKSNITEILKLYLSNELGAVMCSMVPEIEVFIGHQQEVSILSRKDETQKRLFETFTSFFNCFTGQKQLILVVDDLQWADSASLQLLEKLLSIQDCKVFIIGAYRDNEVDSTHPLIITLQQFNNIQNIHLKPLKLEYLNEMISETLSLPEKEIYELGTLIHEKTLGNPFFSREFMVTLHEENLISLKDEKWIWDLEKIKMMNFSSNVIDFMIKNLKKESNEMQNVLRLASSIGSTFSTQDLSLIWKEEKDLETVLLEPVRNGWITQLSSHEYQFCHDRFQQSSYELFSEEERIKSHYIIGCAFLERYKEKNIIKERIFKIVNHLNIASSLFEDKNQLLQLNVIAAERCKQNSAVKAAHEFSTIAVGLLESNVWNENAYLAYSVHADTCYGISDIKASGEAFQMLIDNVHNKLQKLKVFSNYMKMYSLTAQYNKGFDILMNVFKMFPCSECLPDIHTDMGALMGFIFGLKQKIDAKIAEFGGIESMDQSFICKDEEMILFQTILAESTDIAFLSDKSTPLLATSCPMLSTYLFFEHGLTDHAPTGFSFVGFYYSCFFKDPNGYKFTLFTEKLIQMNKGPAPYNVATVEFAIATNQQFGGTAKGIMEHLEEGVKYSMSNSEYIFGAYCIGNLIHASLSNGVHSSVFSKFVSYNNVRIISIQNSGI